MNRTIITVLFVLLVGVVALGFYRGWFALSSGSPDAATNKVNVNLTVDRGRMQEDAEMVKNKATQIAGNVTEEAKGPGDLPRDKVKSIDP
jgi:hypothetical protein